jgi:hypothetical protein
MATLSLPAAVFSIPPVTRFFLVATLAFTLLYVWLRWQFMLEYNPYLALIPGSSIFYPWTFVTSGLLESTIVEVNKSRL